MKEDFLKPPSAWDFSAFSHYFNEGWDNYSQAEEGYTQLAASGYIMGYYRDSRCVGIIFAREPDVNDYPWPLDPALTPLCICNLAVFPEFQGQGIGTALVRRILKIAKYHSFKYHDTHEYKRFRPYQFVYFGSDPAMKGIAERLDFTTDWCTTDPNCLIWCCKNVSRPEEIED